jgi:5-methylcytosine-specific restriction endonuclease McrA
MAKKKPKYNPNSVIRGALRRAFARSPLVQEVMAESRREEPRYKQDGTRHKKNWVQRQCQVCGNWESSSKMAVDHIQPVVSVDNGFQDWNEFITRLWCDKSNLQRICDTCHDKKTTEERIARLLKQYTEELDQIEKTIRVMGGLRNLLEAGGITKKSLIKDLSKYTAKKKTVGLESVVQRALILKNGLKNK